MLDRRPHARPIAWLALAWLLLLFCLPPAGCGQSAPPTGTPTPPSGPRAFPTGTDLTWPLIQPEFHADVLVPIGSAQGQPVLSGRAPITGSCWPMSAGGILARFAGPSVPSPAEKYAQLALDAKGAQALSDWLTQNQGGSAAAAGQGGGICQGWANAAVAENAPGPGVSVRRAGTGLRSHYTRCRTAETLRTDSGCVAFSAGDLLALLAEAYSAAPGMVVGARCTDDRVFYGGDGRATFNNCAADAGLFFLAISNYVGRYHRALVMTTDTGPVWERPVYGYAITLYEAVTGGSARQLTGRDPAAAPDTPAGYRHVRMDLVVGDVSDGTPQDAPGTPGGVHLPLELILTLDSDGQVTGGQWIGTGTPPGITYLPSGPGTTAPGVLYRDVRALLEASQP